MQQSRFFYAACPVCGDTHSTFHGMTFETSDAGKQKTRMHFKCEFSQHSFYWELDQYGGEHRFTATPGDSVA